MKVESRGPVAQDPVPAPAPQKVAPPSSPYKDALYTVGKTVGWGIFSCFRFCVRETYSYIITYIPRYYVPILLNKFESDPFSLITEVLDLINRNPSKANRILTFLAQHCQDNLVKYSPYDGGPEKQLENRKKWILKVNDDVVTKCILTPRQREIEKKLEDYNFEGVEGSVVSFSMEVWNARKNQFKPEIIQFGNDFQEAQARKGKFSALWQTLLLQLTRDFKDLSLESHSPIINPIPNELVTFGNFIERLLFNTDGSEQNLRKLTNLLEKGKFDHWANYSNDLLTFILSEKDISPNIHELCSKLNMILENDKMRATLHQIVSRVIAIFRPNG